MSIQRWKPTDAALIVAGADVEYVTYADHVAAVAAAEQRVLDEERTKEKWFCSEEDKQALIAHGVKAARDAVAACIHGPGGYHPATALAAIDALRGESNG